MKRLGILQFFALLVVCMSAPILSAQDQTSQPQQAPEPFQEFQHRFISKASDSFFTLSPSPDQVTYAAISRGFVARTSVHVLNAANLRIVYTRPKQNTHVDTIELKTPPDQTNCSRDRWGCNSDCGWLDVGCHIAKVACEAWKASNISICEAQKAAREVFSDKIIADVNPGGITTAGILSAGPIQGSISDDLAQLALSVPYSGHVWVAGQLYVTPKPLVFLTACIPQTLTIPDTEISSSSENLAISGSATFMQSDNTIIVSAHFNVPSITLNFAENPIILALRNNPQSLLFCPVLESIGVVIGEITGDLRKTSYDISLPGLPDVSTKIEPVSITVANKSLSLTPTIETKSIVFRASLPKTEGLK
jgi:hypothetical protein